MRGLPPGLAVVLAGTIFALAGCGGTTTYSEADSRSCLEKAEVTVKSSPPADFVASSAEGGSFTAQVPGNKVTISFGLDRNGAEHIVRGYQHFRGKNIGLEDVLRPKHNAVMLWALHPADADVATIEACLK
jgi:hypothetical protein